MVASVFVLGRGESNFHQAGFFLRLGSAQNKKDKMLSCQPPLGLSFSPLAGDNTESG